MSEKNSLEHYGVPGMKWGHRKLSSIKTSSPPKRSSPSADHVETRSLKREKTKTLSNAEIRKVNDRLQLEQSLSKLSQKDSRVIKGHEAVKTALAIGTTVASAYALSQTPAGKAAIKLGKDLLSKQG